ncbi:MAG TPA: hypothetical protein VKU61_00590, partial [Candidatus Binatia bacterium]|nr:hypothetical protein [Candidatus Binatia bacterium]
MPCDPRGRVLLPALTADAATEALASPWLPAAAIEAAALARRAAGARVPVLLAMSHGAGRLRIARALHALGAAGGPLVAVTGRRPALGALPAGATLHLDVGRLAPEAVVALEAVLDDGLVWVLAGLDSALPLPPPLVHRLGAVRIDVPPLAERPADVA